MSLPFLSGRLLRLLCLSVLVCAPLQSPWAAGRVIAGEGFRYQIDPQRPSWVELSRPAPPPPAQSSVEVDMLDVQTRVSAKSATRFVRLIQRAKTPEGLPAISQLQLDYQPAFQELVLHKLEIERGGRHINRIDDTEFRLLQRELDLDQLMYTGTLTLSAVLRDVRIGDRVIVEFSLRGSNPVFAGRYSTIEWLASSSGPSGKLSIRVLMPKGRSLHSRVGPRGVKVQQRDLGNFVEYRVERSSVPMMSLAPKTHASVLNDYVVQLSEFASWQDVAEWGEKLYPIGSNSPEIQNLVASIRSQSSDPETRATRALDFVQREIRYFGTEVGPNTHRPFSAEKVLAQRFGDCKDKTLLLLTLLEALGISGAPVFVSTLQRDFVSDLLPSPLAFDHVIARVELEGQTLWLDGTRQAQTGPLARRSVVGLGKGLPAVRGDSQLVRIPSGNTQLRAEVLDRFFQAEWRHEPRLESTVSFHADHAEMMRNTLAMGGVEQVKLAINDAYRRLYPGLRALGEPEISRSNDDDAFVVRQTFSVPGFWSFEEEVLASSNVVHWLLIETLRFPADAERKLAYHQGLPGKYRHRIRIEVPQKVFSVGSPETRKIRDAAFRLESSRQLSGDLAILDAELQLLNERIPTRRWRSFTENVVEAADGLGIGIRYPTAERELLSEKEILSAAKRALQRHKFTARTDDQRNALFEIGLRTLQIESGRLSPEMRAEALELRAIELDNIFALDHGWSDFVAALELKPEDDSLLYEAMVNALLRVDHATLKALSERLQASNPELWRSQGQQLMGRAAYFDGDYARAREYLADSAALSEPDDAAYAGLYLALSNLAQPAGGLDVREIVPLDDASDWPRQLLGALLDNHSDRSIIDAAKREESADEALAEAYYYLGERARAQGNPRQAKKYYKLAMKQNVTQFVEHAFSSWRLDRL